MNQKKLANYRSVSDSHVRRQGSPWLKVALLIALVTPLIFIESEASAKHDATAGLELRQNFPRPEKFNAKIDFWKKIFTVYASHQIVIHDNWYLDVIYEVINVEGMAEAEASALGRAARQRYVELTAKVIDAWGAPYLMTAEEKRVYRLLMNIKESPYYPTAKAMHRVRNQSGCADKFKNGLIRSGRYIAVMKEIFKNKGLPEQLIYLPMIESTFNPAATSHAGAAGMWQFMQGTGVMYGLKVNRYIDERRDPIKATIAAANLLADNYQTLGSWPLAITAYNHGRQGMINAVKEVGSPDIDQIAEKYSGRRFSFASRNFYPEFLAAVDICSDYKHHFGDLRFDPPMSLAQVELKAGISIKQLENISGLEKSLIHDLNPALKAPFFVKGANFPHTYKLNIPDEMARMVIDQLALLTEPPPQLPGQNVRRHIVGKGETLHQIAARYGTSVDNLMRANRIHNPKTVRYRQQLIIPDTPPVKKTVAQKSRTQLKPRKHLVQKGQTLSDIARKFNTSIKEITRLNKIDDPCKIVSGSWLLIPEG